MLADSQADSIRRRQDARDIPCSYPDSFADRAPRPRLLPRRIPSAPRRNTLTPRRINLAADRPPPVIRRADLDLLRAAPARLRGIGGPAIQRRQRRGSHSSIDRAKSTCTHLHPLFLGERLESASCGTNEFRLSGVARA